MSETSSTDAAASEDEPAAPLLVIYFWAAAVGLLTGAAGTLFEIVLTNIHAIRDVLHRFNHAVPSIGWIIPVSLSAVTVFLSLALVRRYAPEASGSGIPEVEGALEDIRPVRWMRVIPVKFFGGILAMQGGLVLGREGPTIQIGASLGKMIADCFRLPASACHGLIAAGAAAGLATAFNAPLASVVFILEEMRTSFRFRFANIQAVLIASVVADSVNQLVLGPSPAINMPQFDAPPLLGLVWFALFGCILGIVAVLFNLLLVKTLDLVGNLTGAPYHYLGLGLGGYIGFLGWLSPDAVMGGEDVLPGALAMTIPAAAMLILFVVRFGTTILSYGSGVPGGIFAPLVALGTLLGMCVGSVLHIWEPPVVPEAGVFAVAGMGGLLAATVRAPITAVVLAVELTGNYTLILPTMVTCITATAVHHACGGRPIYSVLLERTLARQKQAVDTDESA